MEDIALYVESNYLGSERAEVMAYLNAEANTGQQLSCLISELQRFDGNMFAVSLSGHEVTGWKSEWINHSLGSFNLLRIKFVKPRARKVDGQAFIDYVNANSETFIKQLTLTLAEKQRVALARQAANLDEDAQRQKAVALTHYHKAVRRRAMEVVGASSIIELLREEIAKAANAMSAAERQTLLDIFVAHQVDKLLCVDYYKDMPKEQVVAAMKMEAPAAMPDWIGHISLMNF